MRYILLSMILALSGCFLPTDGSSIRQTRQKFTIYTDQPSQQVRIQCAEWFWYDGISGTDPHWSDNYFVGWKTMKTGYTGSSPINPSQTEKLYTKVLRVNPNDFVVDTKDFVGCYGPYGRIEIRPQVKVNGNWSNWLTFDNAAWSCLTDHDQHNDDENNPDWPKRSLACYSGTTANYIVR